MKKLITLLLVLCAGVMNVSADTWTVAGTEALMGSNWSATDTNNDMALISGTNLYVLKKENVSLSAGTTYEFKVVKDHAWTTAHPATNYALYIEKDGTYDIIFTFDTDTKNVGGYTSMSVAGNEALIGVDWDTTKNDMTFNEDGGFFTLSLTKAYTAGDYKFKVVKDHRWGNGSWPASDYELHIASAGTYTIVFNYYPSDNSVMAAEAVTTNASGYCTYVNNNHVNITGKASESIVPTGLLL